MKYDFDTVIDRTNTGASKWDTLEDRFGTKDVVPMWVADMDFPSPPPVIEALVERSKHGLYGYTIRSASYLDAITGWMERRHHWNVQTEWLAHSPGVVPALGFAVNAFTQPGDKIVLQPPVYYPFMKVVELQGREVVNNPLKFTGGRYEMDFEDLEAKLSKDSSIKMLILCSPHNPVGRVWTPEELRQLGEICLHHGVLVISDEIHSDLVYKRYTHTPFASLSDAFAENSITCIAPSKTFNLAGLQTSALIIPNETIRKRFNQELENHFIGLPNAFGLTAAYAAYTQGDEWLDQLLDYLDGNVDLVETFCEQHIPQIKVIRPEGTYLVWLDCRGLGLDDETLDRFMVHDAKVAFDEGHIFGEGGSGFQRMNVACPRSLVLQALEGMKDAVSKLNC